MHRTRITLIATAFAFALGSAALPSIALAKSNGTEAKEKKPKKAKKPKASRAGTVTFHDGSAENRSERERRLMRECKGRPNSGVCEGFTRP